MVSGPDVGAHKRNGQKRLLFLEDRGRCASRDNWAFGRVSAQTAYRNKHRRAEKQSKVRFCRDPENGPVESAEPIGRSEKGPDSRFHPY